MEKQLFNYIGRGIKGRVFEFCDCTLKVDIGPYSKGSIIEWITLDYANGMLRFRDKHDGPSVYEHQLTFAL